MSSNSLIIMNGFSYTSISLILLSLYINGSSAYANIRENPDIDGVALTLMINFLSSLVFYSHHFPFFWMFLLNDG